MLVQRWTDSLYKQTSDTMKTVMTSRDSAKIRSHALQVVNDYQFTKADSIDIRLTLASLIQEYSGAYLQFNPDNTYAISFKQGEVATGKYKINRKVDTIEMSGDNTDKYYYYFINGMLNIRSHDGQMEVLLKRQ